MATGKTKRRPTLPAPPSVLDDVILYLSQLDRGINDSYDDLAVLLPFSVAVRDSTAFAATDTSVAVVLGSPFTDTDYHVSMTPNWNAAMWVTSQLSTGFTINASAAPGGSGGTVTWIISR